MQRLTSFVLSLVIVSVVAGLVPAGVSANRPAFRFSFQFQSFDRVGCMETYFNLEAGTGSDGQPFMDLDSLTMIDHCYTEPTQQFRVSAYARTGDFTVKADGQLRKGSITATLPVVSCNGGLCDWVGDTITVNLAISGIGELQGHPSSSISRTAIATGTITGRFGQNFSPEAAEGFIGKAK